MLKKELQRTWDRLYIAERCWAFSKVLILIELVWAIWIFGIVWQGYGENINLIEGGILLTLAAIMIMLRETTLHIQRGKEKI